jgi:Cdc6-like AAA superfamily ATPase
MREAELYRITFEKEKDLTDRRIADYIWKLDNTGLTISRISSKRYGKERVLRLGVPINIITRILERLENG